MISDIEKQIYNSFIISNRKAKNLPFTFRKNFKNIDSSTELYLKKLSQFFIKYKHVNRDDFFIAPYIIYNTNTYYDLHFFTTRKAIKCYTIYIKNKQTSIPDNDDTINDCKAGLKFIYTFCKDININITQYKNYIGRDETIPAILQHLRDHSINFYILHGLKFEDSLKKIEPDIINFIISDFWSIFKQTQIKYLTSTKLKQTITEGIKIIEKTLLINNNKTI